MWKVAYMFNKASAGSQKTSGCPSGWEFGDIVKRNYVMLQRVTAMKLAVTHKYGPFHAACPNRPILLPLVILTKPHL
jgi:hypothetical protein